MSEASNVWRVEADGATHEIEVDHSTMTGKIVLKLDGRVIDEERLWFAKKPLDFSVGSHPARVTVEYAYSGLATRSTLHVDNRYVEPLAG